MKKNQSKNGKGGILSLAIILVWVASCSPQFVRNKEAREDALAYKAACDRQDKISHVVMPTAETAPVKCLNTTDDAADDPAIWHHPTDSSLSRVFGSNKKAGIHSYDLNGKEMQFVNCGRINNIDIRQGVIFGGRKVDIVAGSNRDDKSIDLFLIDENGKIPTTLLGKISLGDLKPYGFCLGKSEDNLLHLYVNDKKGRLYHFAVNAAGNLQDLQIRKLKFATQLEGMVVDDETGTLYVGEEQKGVWICEAFDIQSQSKSLLSGSTEKNSSISYDIEGLALLPPHYLVASSQGNFSYAIFDLDTRSYLTSFKIGSGTKVDGVQETDGLEISDRPMGKYKQGMLVVQDGYNYNDTLLQRQNYKYIPLEEITQLIKNH